MQVDYTYIYQYDVFVQNVLACLIFLRQLIVNQICFYRLYNMVCYIFAIEKKSGGFLSLQFAELVALIVFVVWIVSLVSIC